MSKEELDTASEELRGATADIADDDVRERVEKQAEELSELSEGDSGPDQGRLDRHMHILREIRDDTDGTAREHVERALEHVTRYRETVEGI